MVHEKKEDRDRIGAVKALTFLQDAIAAIYSITVCENTKYTNRKSHLLIIPVFSIWPHVLIHITPDISSLARLLGKNHLAFRIHPWQCSGMSWHAASIASRRDIWSCG